MRGDLLAALLTLLLGALVLASGLRIEEGAGYDRIGPRFFPVLVSLGLVASALALAAGATRSSESLAPGEPMAMTGLVTVAGGLVAGGLFLEPVGFIVTATLLFALVARGFQSARPLRDAALGLALAAIVYLAFTEGLGLSLPSGFWSRYS